MIKMIVMDLDGTLLLPNKKMDPYTVQMIKKAKERGILIVIATGREKSGIPNVIEALQLEEGNHYIAGFNGEMIYSFKDHEYTIEDVFMEEDAHKVFYLAQKLGFMAIAMCGYVRYSFASKRLRILNNIYNFLVGKKGDYGLKHQNWKFEIVDDPNISIPQAINKFVCIQSKSFFRKNRKQMEQELSEYDVMSVGPNWFEIMPKGVNKGSAVKKIAEKEGIHLDEILVFGDAENDISMIQAVKYGYAMGNAMDNVKKVAYAVCDSNKEQGIAKVINEYLGEDNYD